MHCTTILAAAIFCTAVSSQEYAGPSQCGCLEVPATGRRHKDQFCRPHLTIPSERHKQRSCVCRPGLVRNAWGDCITKKECTSCKCFRDRDFNVCGRECPAVCNEPISRSCSKSCAFGCDCRPGFVRSSRHRGRCVKAEKCALSCPPFSRFEFCRSTCAPKCGRRPRKTCVTRCTRGDCVCNHGYAEVKHNGETICVPQDQCSQYLQLAPSITPGGNGSLGGGISSGGSVFVPGAPSIPVHPGVVSGGATGSPLPGSVGITGNVGGGVSSGGSVSIPGTPSIPVHPGVVTGGAAGPSLPGSVGIGGSSHIPSAPAGGSVGVVTTVGGTNQSGSFGSGGVLHIPGVTGGVSVGTPSHGVVARTPGSPDAQGRPSIGTNGFGSAGGGIFTSSIGPDDSMESGEGRGVDATGIPQHPGASPPAGAAVSTGTIPSNGNYGFGGVGGGLKPGIIPPKVTAVPGPVVGVGIGGSGHGTATSPLPHTPGTNTAVTHLPGSVVTWPRGQPSGSMPSPVPINPGFSGVSGGVVAAGTTHSAATAVPSGVPSPSGIPPAGTVVVSNGVIGNGGIIPDHSGTNVASTSSSNVVGGMPSVVRVQQVGGHVTGSAAPGVAGSGIVTGSALPPTTVIHGGTATAVLPGSVSPAGEGALSGLTGGASSSSGISSSVASIGRSSAPAGVIGGSGALHTGPTASTSVVAPSTVGVAGSSTVGTSLVPLQGGFAGAVGRDSNIGVNAAGQGVSVGTRAVTTAAGGVSAVPAATAAATAPAVGGALLAGTSALPSTITGMRASGVIGINSAPHSTVRCGSPGSPC